MERFACPTADRIGRYHCIDDHALCDGFIDCPGGGEDEDRKACMFYKTVSLSSIRVAINFSCTPALTQSTLCNLLQFLGDARRDIHPLISRREKFNWKYARRVELQITWPASMGNLLDNHPATIISKRRSLLERFFDRMSFKEFLLIEWIRTYRHGWILEKKPYYFVLTLARLPLKLRSSWIDIMKFAYANSKSASNRRNVGSFTIQFAQW